MANAPTGDDVYGRKNSNARWPRCWAPKMPSTWPPAPCRIKSPCARTPCRVIPRCSIKMRTSICLKAAALRRSREFFLACCLACAAFSVPMTCARTQHCRSPGRSPPVERHRRHRHSRKKLRPALRYHQCLFFERFGRAGGFGFVRQERFHHPRAAFQTSVWRRVPASRHHRRRGAPRHPAPSCAAR